MAPDPFDALRTPIEPVQPDAAFAAELRRRVAAALGVDPDPDPGGAPVSTTDTAAPATHTLRPYLIAAGARDAIRFYADVFGATVVAPPLVDEQGRIGHVELDIDGARLYLADEHPEYDIRAPQGGRSGVGLNLRVADARAVADRAVELGATILQPVDLQPYGDVAGTFLDPFGHGWQVNSPGIALSPDEHDARMAGAGYVPGDVDLSGGRDRGPSPRATRVPGVGYFTVDAPDGGRAVAFYSALFGWTPEPGDQPDGYHVSNVDPPGGIAGGAAEPGTTIYFRVDDLERVVARVRELGGEVLSQTSYTSGRNAVCRDDQGVELNLWEPAPGY